LGLFAVTLLAGCSTAHRELAETFQAATDERVIFHGPTDQKRIALTFDDGPDATWTPLLLDLLADHGARATFFVFAGEAEMHPDLMQRIVTEGHEIGNHLLHGEFDGGMAAEDWQLKFEASLEILSRFAPICVYRPGNAFWRGHMLDWIAEHEPEMRIVVGSVWPFDTAIPSARFARWWTRSAIHPGAILVFHENDDRGRRALAALQVLIPQVTEDGYDFVTLSDLLDASEVCVSTPPEESLEVGDF
jgi:peptidoglycan/xylan/chitin deacetylase (PgdA/CDA1 family)